MTVLLFQYIVNFSFDTRNLKFLLDSFVLSDVSVFYLNVFYDTCNVYIVSLILSS